MLHAFLAAGHREQTAIERLVPVPVMPRRGEGAVEGDAVPVALGVGEGSIHVEDQCLG